MAKARPRTKEPPKKRPETFPAEFLSGRTQYLIVVVLGLILYANTFTNTYVFDDGIVIQRNNYVQEGLSGIPKIFTSDVYQSFYAQMNAEQQLSGGRYRPLSVASFAVEQQFLGSKAQVKPVNDLAMVRHVGNVLLYLLSAVLLLRFLRHDLLPQSPQAAFLACIIFLVHPLHTEVVANIKSRDEILSFLFIILTLTMVNRYRETGQTSRLLIGLLSFSLALLSKEYAVTLIALIPLFLIVVKKESWAKSLKTVLPFFGVFVLYLILRISIVGLGSTQENSDVLNNPYLFATPPQKWATKIETLIRYPKLLIFPHPLSCDYSYRAIPFTDFQDPKVWFSILLHLAMIAVTIILFIRRNILAFALAFYLTHLFLVSNLLVDIGATMGERLIYHSSLGFALAVAILLDRYWLSLGQGMRKTQLTIAASLLFAVTAGAIVIPRNAQWKTDASLYISDAQVMPNSAFLNGNAGKAYLDLADLPENKAIATELTTKSIPFSEKAISIHQAYLNAYLNLGVASFRLGDPEKAEQYWNIARKIYPDHPWVMQNLRALAHLYDNKAAALSSDNNAEALRLLEKAVGADPVSAEIWNHLGEAYFRADDLTRARTAWTKALQLKPDFGEVEAKLSTLPAP